MATIKSFKGIRPAAAHAAQVAALPYDVMNESEARALTAENPLSFLNIDRSEVHFPVGTDPHTQPVYEKAAQILQKFIADGILIQDPAPSLYIYRLTMDGISQTGLVACVSVDEYLDGTIKKHEFTRKDKEQDRINHVDYCNANTGPIFLAHKGRAEIQALMDEWTQTQAPVYDFIADDGIGHTVWTLADPATMAKIIQAFEKIDNLYIADGHHRAASAVQVARQRREENPTYTGQEEFNYFLSVIFPADQLRILDYNRLVQDLNQKTETELLTAIGEKFDLSPHQELGPYRPIQPKEYGMFLGNQWYKLTAKDAIIPDDAVGALDVSLLQDNLLQPLLGIEDPRTDSRIDFVGGIRGLQTLEDQVRSGRAKIAFALYPTSFDELMVVADSDRVMPPKSTWFEPKLRSGLFIHNLS